MNVRTVERAVWTLGIGGFLAYLLGALLAPNPTRVLPYAVGGLVVALPVAHWYVGERLDDFPGEAAGRLTLFFLALFVVTYLGFEAVEAVTEPDTTAEWVGRVASVVVGLRAGSRVARGAGYDRVRSALGASSE